MSNTDRLDNAIKLMTDAESTLTFEERFNELSQAIMWNAFKVIERVSKHGSKDPVTDEERYKQEEIMNQFKMIEKVYSSMKKTAAKTPGGGSKVDDQTRLAFIKNKDKTLGSLVRSVPQNEQQPDEQQNLQN